MGKGSQRTGNSPYSKVSKTNNCPPDVRLSKALSYLLRHGAEREGFRLLPGGFLYVDEILANHRQFQSVKLEDIQRIVTTNDKQRFNIEEEADTGRLKIRANQGHTLEVNDLELTPITDAQNFPKVIHGTTPQAYKSIQKQGLSRMARIHIHFAIGEPGEDKVISGIRKLATIWIYLNLSKAIEAGLKFYLSANNVILCPGNEKGVIPPIYFEKIVDSTTKETMTTMSSHCSEIKAVTAEEVADTLESKKDRRKNKKVQKDKMSGYPQSSSPGGIHRTNLMTLEATA